MDYYKIETIKKHMANMCNYGANSRSTNERQYYPNSKDGRLRHREKMAIQMEIKHCKEWLDRHYEFSIPQTKEETVGNYIFPKLYPKNVYVKK